MYKQCTCLMFIDLGVKPMKSDITVCPSIQQLLPAIRQVSSEFQGRRLYVFKVFIEYPLNFGSDCISMFSVKLTFDKILMM